MKGTHFKEIFVAFLWLVVVGGLGFAWMYGFLSLVATLSPFNHLLFASIAGPVGAIGLSFFLISRGENTLVELAIWFSLPCGFLIALFLLERWASLALVWDILLAIVLAVPAGLLSIALLSLILAPLAFVIGRLVGASESNENKSIR